MTTKKILIEFIKLFDKCGLSKDDYCFGGEYALKYLGLAVRPRRNHFDFHVNTKKLPWKTRRFSDITMPHKNSKEFKVLSKFIIRTGSDPHFLPWSYVGITEQNLPKRTIVSNISGYRLRIIRPEKEIKILYNIFSKFDIKKRWPEEKIKRWLRTFTVFHIAAKHSKNSEMERYARSGINLLNKLVRHSPKFNQADGNALQKLVGKVGHLGKARGYARIVLHNTDLSRVRSGDIIVCKFARPEFIQIMKKAGAVIADQGGTTSHAAVISREWGIPCVIGTKIATKVLKDGDLVEVNADEGIVRKVNE